MDYQCMECGNLVEVVWAKHPNGGIVDNSVKEVVAPNNYLLFVEQGYLELKYDGRIITIPQGGFCLVRKYTVLRIREKSGLFGLPFKKTRIDLYDCYISQVIDKVTINGQFPLVKDRIIPLAPSHKLVDTVCLFKDLHKHTVALQPNQLELIVENAINSIISQCHNGGSI